MNRTHQIAALFLSLSSVHAGDVIDTFTDVPAITWSTNSFAPSKTVHFVSANSGVEFDITISTDGGNLKTNRDELVDTTAFDPDWFGGTLTFTVANVTGAAPGDVTFRLLDVTGRVLANGPIEFGSSVTPTANIPTGTTAWEQPFTVTLDGAAASMAGGSYSATLRWPDWDGLPPDVGNEAVGRWTSFSFEVTTAVITPGIDPDHRFAWGENIGWTDWRWDPPTDGAGASIGQFFCEGLVWGENVGWIHLGDGSPADGIRYANTDASDFGVNHDGSGNFSGLAWGENIGWIDFGWAAAGDSARPRIDLSTGRFSGYVWSENCGWIDLGSNGTHFVKAEAIQEGPDTDGDMIADAWELEQAADAGLGASLTHLDKTTDTDGDGASDFEEYLADTDPFDPGDTLRILTIGVDEVLADITLEWTSSPRRLYDLGRSTDLNSFPVEAPGIVPDPGATTSFLLDLTPPLPPRSFWRVGAKLPLAAP